VADPQVLVVTSGTAPSAAVVPVLAAIEAAGMRVRAIDVGSGDGIADRVRRVFGGERRLRNELDTNPPDAAVVFDPHAALALTVARDQVQNPAPVIAVVGELDPATGWAQTDADRFLAVDELAAVRAGRRRRRGRSDHRRRRVSASARSPMRARSTARWCGSGSSSPARSRSSR